MTDQQYSGGEADQTSKSGEVNDANAADSVSLNEWGADNGGPEASDDAAQGADGAENSSGAAGDEDFAASAVSRGNELSAGQADQLAALETLFTAMAAQQKQTMDLIGRALTDNANAVAALADLRRMLERNAGRGQNDNRNGMQ